MRINISPRIQPSSGGQPDYQTQVVAADHSNPLIDAGFRLAQTGLQLGAQLKGQQVKNANYQFRMEATEAAGMAMQEAAANQNPRKRQEILQKYQDDFTAKFHQYEHRETEEAKRFFEAQQKNFRLAAHRNELQIQVMDSIDLSENNLDHNERSHDDIGTKLQIAEDLIRTDHHAGLFNAEQTEKRLEQRRGRLTYNYFANETQGSLKNLANQQIQVFNKQAIPAKQQDVQQQFAAYRQQVTESDLPVPEAVRADLIKQSEKLEKVMLQRVEKSYENNSLAAVADMTRRVEYLMTPDPKTGELPGTGEQINNEINLIRHLGAQIGDEDLAESLIEELQSGRVKQIGDAADLQLANLKYQVVNGDVSRGDAIERVKELRKKYGSEMPAAELSKFATYLNTLQGIGPNAQITKAAKETFNILRKAGTFGTVLYKDGKDVTKQTLAEQKEKLVGTEDENDGSGFFIDDDYTQEEAAEKNLEAIKKNQQVETDFYKPEAEFWDKINRWIESGAADGLTPQQIEQYMMDAALPYRELKTINELIDAGY